MSVTTGSADVFNVVIPARLDSKRLPGKPLRLLGGRPLIRHVYENARYSGAEQVVVATDSEDIAACIRGVGGEVQMTSPDCASGSDRVAAAVAAMQWHEEAIVVNVQGDEPFLEPEDVRLAAISLARFPEAKIATLSAPLTPAGREDSNIVKVVCDDNDMALRFSRAWIEHEECICRRHLGIYAYRCSYLQRFTKLPAPEIERRERLEQLRAMYHGDPIHVSPAVSKIVFGIDSEDELYAAERLLGGA